MSKLIKKLRQISGNATPPMGFKTTTTSPNKLMLLIVALPNSDTKWAAQLSGAEVDAVLIHSKDLGRELQTIKSIASSVDDIPWGVWSETVTTDGIEGLKEMGGDFIIFIASEAPASLLQEEIGKVIKITPPFEEGLISTIDQLTIDAVILDFRGEGKPLTISQLMNCQWIAGSINKPLLVTTQQGLVDKEIQALWDAGVSGVVVEVEEESLIELKKLHQVIEALSPISKKPGERRAVLPRLEGEEGSVFPQEI